MNIYKIEAEDRSEGDKKETLNNPSKIEVQIPNVEPENNTEDLVQELFSNYSLGLDDPTKIATLISKIAANPDKLASKYIVESPLIPNILTTLDRYPSAFLIKSISDLIFYSPMLTHILFQQKFLHLIYDLILKPGNEISHQALKFIRKIIPIGMENRVVLFGSGFINVIITLFQQNINIQQFVYAAHTIAVFVIYDPVYGSNSYCNSARSLPSRSEIINQCSDLGFNQKELLQISNFLKFGHSPRIHKSLYQFIQMLLFEIQDENLNFYGIWMSEFLSNYCENNAARIAELSYRTIVIEDEALKKNKAVNVSFFELARAAIEWPSPRIHLSIINTIRNIIFHRGRYYEKQLQKNDPFQVIYEYLCQEEAPDDVRIACARCIFYAMKYLPFAYNNFLNPEIMNTFIEIYNGDSPIKLRNNMVCLIIVLAYPLLSKDIQTIKLPLNEDNLQLIPSPITASIVPLIIEEQLLISFADHLDDYDKEQRYAVLEYFKLLTDNSYIAEAMRATLIPENIIDRLDALLEYADADAEELILFLHNFFAQDDEEEDN